MPLHKNNFAQLKTAPLCSATLWSQNSVAHVHVRIRVLDHNFHLTICVFYGLLGPIGLVFAHRTWIFDISKCYVEHKNCSNTTSPTAMLWVRNKPADFRLLVDSLPLIYRLSCSRTWIVEANILWNGNIYSRNTASKLTFVFRWTWSVEFRSKWIAQLNGIRCTWWLITNCFVVLQNEISTYSLRIR